MDAILSLVALRVLAEVIKDGNERDRTGTGENRGQNNTASSSNTSDGFKEPRTREEEEAQLQKALALSLAGAEQERAVQSDETGPSGDHEPSEGDKPSADSGRATVPPEQTSIVECPVCLAQDRQALRLGVFTTRCGHVVCGACVDQLHRFHNKCPICRVEVRREEMVKIYL